VPADGGVRPFGELERKVAHEDGEHGFELCDREYLGEKKEKRSEIKG
jgi:hypothetical protein